MMSNVIDLTQTRPSQAFSTFQPSDVVLIAVTGGVGYLAKEAYKHFFPGPPSVVEQIKVLTELIAVCGKAKAKSLKVRVSSNAQLSLQFPGNVKEAKVVSDNGNTIDLEIVFRSPRQPHARPTT